MASLYAKFTESGHGRHSMLTGQGCAKCAASQRSQRPGQPASGSHHPVSPFALWLCPHHWAGPGAALSWLGAKGRHIMKVPGIQTDSWACALFSSLRNACRIAGGMFLVSAKLTTVTLLSPIIKVAREAPAGLSAPVRTPAIKPPGLLPGCDHSPGPG